MGRRKPPIQANFVPIDLSGGLDARTDYHKVQPPNTIRATNIRYDVGSAVRRRPGTAAVTSPTVPAKTGIVGATNNETLAIDTTGVVTAFNATSNTWRIRGQGAPYQLQAKPSAQVSQGGSTSFFGSVWQQLRDVSSAQIGNIGLAVYDNGATIAQKYAGLVSVVCYDVTTGKQYWSVTTGGTALSANYRVYGASSNSTITTPVAVGAMSPTVLAYKNYFILCYQTAFTGTDSYTGIAGTCIGLTCYYSPLIDGMTVPTQFDVGTTWPQLGGTASFPWFMNVIGGSSTPGMPYHYYDLTGNDVSYCIAGCGQSFTTGGAPVTTNMASSGNPQLCSLGGAGSTPAATAVCFNLRSMAVTPYVPVSAGSSGGPGPMCISTTAGSNYFIVGTPMEMHLLNPFLNSDASVALTSALTSPYSTAAVTAPIASAFNGTTGWVTNGYKTYTCNVTPPSMTPASLGSVAVNVDGVLAAPVLQGPSEMYSGAIYSRIVFCVDPIDGQTYPCAWLCAPGQFGQLVFTRLTNPPSQPYARGFYLRYSGTSSNRHPANINVVGTSLTTCVPVVQSVADNVATLTHTTITPATSPQIIRVPQGALLTGSDTRYYDGAALHSAGWLTIPSYPSQTAVQSTTGGTLIAGQKYTYFFVYVDYDAYGNAIYSSPSAPITVTILASNNAALFSALPQPTRILTSLGRLFIYRNCVSTGAAVGIQYYRVAQFALSSANAITLGVPVVPATWTDSTQEDCTGNALLYSPPNGGELPNDPAPPSTCGVATKSRVFLASAEVGSWLYPSKPFYPGRAPEFNSGQFLDIDPSSGPIIGLAALDENIIIFKFDRIYVLGGNGPDATGNGSFNLPQNISSDVGLKDPASVITTEDGVYFRSTRGLQLLNRSFQLQWVGQNVDALLAGVTVTGAALCPPSTTIRFALSNNQTLVYDYTAQAWSVYVYSFGASCTPASLAMDPQQTRLWFSCQGTNGLVAYEQAVTDLTSFTDAGSIYAGTVQSPYMPINGPQGWGRARRCNIYGTTATGGAVLTITFSYDEGQATSSPITYTLPATTGPFEVRIRLPRQLCRSVAVTISSSGTTDDCVITGLELETQIKSGAARTPDTASN